MDSAKDLLTIFRLRPLARREALPVPGRGVEIVEAKLGDNAGIVGAAVLGAA